ncbi:PepSY domain-containing protein [Saccharibacillus alkalitolerans]|uniref:PepSY domain-containing protein n=1 Tax=Saccharibacillus alkalitolerans TaxID=2705290 RepID=A0ABX0FB28_9BACL|nr:PepSY domain-containing protein [Saccharibacillus alkalitolerans]NGZ77585.1 hypothetical protein [Saccharibacillus alkalitolerans]
MKRRAAWPAAALLIAAASAGLLVWSPWNAADPSMTQAEAESKLLKLYAGSIESARRAGDLYEMRLRTEAGLYAVQLSAADGRVESIRRLEAAPAEPPKIVSRETIKTRLEEQTGVRVDSLELETGDEGTRSLYVAELSKASGERRRLEIDAYSGETVTDRAIAPSSPDDTRPPSEGTADSTDKGKEGSPGQSAGEPRPSVPSRLLTEDQAKAAAAAALGAEIGAVEDSDAELRSQEDGQAYYLVDVELKNGRKAEVQINAVSGAMRTITWDEEDAAPQPPKKGTNGSDDRSDDDDDSDDDDGSGDEDGEDENT